MAKNRQKKEPFGTVLQKFFLFNFSTELDFRRRFCFKCYHFPKGRVTFMIQKSSIRWSPPLIQRPQSAHIPRIFLYHSVPVPHWHHSTLFLQHSRPNHTGFSTQFPNCYQLFFFSPDRSSISHSAFSHCVHNWRQTNLAFTITLSIRLITGLKIENTVDCDGTEPSGWDNHVTGCVMNVLWPTPEDFLI